ncbi:MAG: hypothetical protein ACRDNR_17905 [Gaiellaceae bacterium]
MWRLGLIVSSVVILAGCGGGSGDDGAASRTTTQPRAADAFELEGQTLDGRNLSLADVGGKPVYVNVWASW